MDRNNIDKKYQWDLSKIYSSIDEFRNDISLVKEKLPEFSKFQGINYNEESLYEVLDLCMTVSRMLEKLEAYTSLLLSSTLLTIRNPWLPPPITTLTLFTILW